MTADECVSLLPAGQAVCVIRPDNQRSLDSPSVSEAFLLTPGEARVAALVGAGASPAEAATQLSIAYETVRTVLQKVYTKTGVRRQGELVALISRLPHLD